MPAWRDAIPRNPKDEGIGTDDAPQGGGLDRTLRPGLDPGQPGRDLNLVVAIHRRVRSTTTGSQTAHMPRRRRAAPTSAQTPTVVAASPATVEPPPPPKPPEEPTANLAQIRGGDRPGEGSRPRADRRASVLEKAGPASIAEWEKWKHREMLVRQQIAELNEKADNLSGMPHARRRAGRSGPRAQRAQGGADQDGQR